MGLISRLVALAVCSIVCAGSSLAQTLSTNNVTIVFNSFAGLNPAVVRAVTVTPQYWATVGNVIFANPPQSISVAQQPQMTNGSVTFSNQISGIPYQVVFSTTYNTLSTNYNIPANTNSLNVTLQTAWIGEYVNPSTFYYPNPTVTNISLNVVSQLTNGVNTTVRNVNGINYVDVTNVPGNIVSSPVSEATNALTAGMATNALYAASATNALTAGMATNALYAASATNALTAGMATNALYAASATNALYAASATNAPVFYLVTNYSGSAATLITTNANAQITWWLATNNLPLGGSTPNAATTNVATTQIFSGAIQAPSFIGPASLATNALYAASATNAPVFYLVTNYSGSAATLITTNANAQITWWLATNNLPLGGSTPNAATTNVATTQIFSGAIQAPSFIGPASLATNALYAASATNAINAVTATNLVPFDSSISYGTISGVGTYMASTAGWSNILYLDGSGLFTNSATGQFYFRGSNGSLTNNAMVAAANFIGGAGGLSGITSNGIVSINPNQIYPAITNSGGVAAFTFTNGITNTTIVGFSPVTIGGTNFMVAISAPSTNPPVYYLTSPGDGSGLTNIQPSAVTNAAGFWAAAPSSSGSIPSGLVTNNTPGAINIATNSTLTTSNGVFNGNVGIGTTNPSVPLEVNGDIWQSWNSNFVGDVFGDGSLFKMGINMVSSSRDMQIWMHSTDGLGVSGITFYTGTAPSERMRVDGFGNVGIGTTSPSAQLTVATNIIAGGTITATNGFASVSGGITNNSAQPIMSMGGFSGNGSGLTNVNALTAGMATNALYAASATNALTAGMATNALYAASATNALTATNYPSGQSFSDNSLNFYLPDGQRLANGSGNVYYPVSGPSGGIFSDNNGDVHFGQNPYDYTKIVFDHLGNQYMASGFIWANTNGNASFTNLAVAAPSGAAAGWVFTLTNSVTGQGTWSNAPAGSSALPAGTNSIWNLTNSANTISGNGGGLTNVQSAVYTGMATNAISGFGMTYFTTNNYTTALIQSATLNNTNGVFFYPGDYYVTSLFMTNGSYWTGKGATLHFTGRTGFMVVATNWYIRGIDDITLSGDNPTNWGTNPAGFAIPLVYPNAYPNYSNPSFSNRSGLLLNVASGIFRNITAKGFEGYGIEMINMNNPATVNIPQSQIQGITVTSNYIGCWLAGIKYDIGDGSGVDQNAEYVALTALNASYNTFGVGLGAGNHNVVNCRINENYCGAWYSFADNPAHGITEDNTFNHNTWSVAGLRTESGELISGNIFAGSGNMWFDNCNFLEIRNNRFQFDNPGFVNFTNDSNSYNQTGGQNHFVANSYYGNWGVDFGVTNGQALVGLDFGGGTLKNYSVNYTNSDGVPIVSLGGFIGNGGGLTNVTSISTVTGIHYVSSTTFSNILTGYMLGTNALGMPIMWAVSTNIISY